MAEIKFKFYLQGFDEVLEVWNPRTSEIVKINSPSEIDIFLDWNLTDEYITDWTIGEDVLGLFS